MDIFWYQNYKLALSLFSCLFEKNHHFFYKFIKSSMFIFGANILFLFFLLSYFLLKWETYCPELAGWDVDEGYMSI